LFDDNILVKVLAVTGARPMDLNLEIIFMRRTRWSWSWRRRRLRWRCWSTGRFYAVVDMAMVVNNFLDDRRSDNGLWWRWRWRRWGWRRSWLSWRLRGWRSLSSANDDLLPLVITRWRRWAGRTWTTNNPFFFFLSYEYSATAGARSRCGTRLLPDMNVDFVLVLTPSV